MRPSNDHLHQPQPIKAEVVVEVAAAEEPGPAVGLAADFPAVVSRERVAAVEALVEGPQGAEPVDREWAPQAVAPRRVRVARVAVWAQRGPHRRQHLLGRWYHRGQRRVFSNRASVRVHDAV